MYGLIGRIRARPGRRDALLRIMQDGTADFDTAASDDSEFRFVGVANPEEVVRAVDRAQRAAAAETRHALS